MTECIRCGDCCDMITYGGTKKYLRRWLTSPDPERFIELWIEARWNPPPTREDWARWKEDAAFIIKHWRRRYGVQPVSLVQGTSREKIWSCDAFDRETRTCMTYETRPPVCRDFPHYDRKYVSRFALGFLPRCSFWANVAVPVVISPRRSIELPVS